MNLTDKFAICVGEEITDKVVNAEFETLDEIREGMKNVLDPNVDYDFEINKTKIGEPKDIAAREAFLLLAFSQTMYLYEVDEITARNMLAMQMKLRRPYQKLWKSKTITRESYVQIRRDIEVYICSRFGVLPTKTEHYMKKFGFLVQDRSFPDQENFSLHIKPTF